MSLTHKPTGINQPDKNAQCVCVCVTAVVLLCCQRLPCPASPGQQRVLQTHPGHEVHGGPPVQQKGSHVDVAIVSSDVERCESTLRTGRERGGGGGAAAAAAVHTKSDRCVPPLTGHFLCHGLGRSNLTWFGMQRTMPLKCAPTTCDLLTMPLTRCYFYL